MDQRLIRNFCIVAHVDHGKSTLADRFLEITKTIPKDKLKEQFLDQNPISRERGITIKLAPVRMLWHPQTRNLKHEIRNNIKIQNLNDQKCFGFRNSDLEFANSEYILNLIDTPGHVDFSYEVSRTLACCEGAVLLVDATQGIQAQTVAHLNAARKENLVIIPVINKIDLENARPEEVAKDLCKVFGFKKEEILPISAKTGENVETLLGEIIQKIPPPSGLVNLPLRALIFDAIYDEHRGVVAYVRIIDGEVKTQDKIELYQKVLKTQVLEVGFFTPFLKKANGLSAGEIGYVITGIKNMRQCRVGDTITILNIKYQKSKIEPLPGYKVPKPMVFFGVYPKSTNEFIRLKQALDKLSLNDTSLTFSEEHSVFLGSGFRVGFLGLLHAEIVKERIKQESGVDPLLTMPQVLYQKNEKGEFLEPYINLDIYAPKNYIGAILTVCQKNKGKLINISYYESYAVLFYQMPYSIFIRDFSSKLKSVSSGFASIDYEFSDYRKADLVCLEISINDTQIDVLSEVVYREDAQYLAREKTENLKKYLSKQQFRQIIHGVVDNRIVAKEEISPFRKDVITKLSGGDRTRKEKLLKKQRKGKQKLLSISKVAIPQEALLSFLTRQAKV